MEELGNNTKQHKMIMTNRKNCSLTGITDVIAFDEKEVVLETQLGTLFIKGDNIHIKRLTLESGEVHFYPPNTWGQFPWTAIEFQELEL